MVHSWGALPAYMASMESRILPHYGAEEQQSSVDEPHIYVNMEEEQLVLLDASGRAIIVAEAGHSAEELLPC